jgi:hypothetical protein
MTLSNNNNKVVCWKQDNKLWFCTGGEKKLTHTQRGCYITNNGGQSFHYDCDEDNEFVFGFEDIGGEIENFEVKLEITPELYVKTLMASGEYFGHWLNSGADTDFNQSDRDMITELFKELGVVPDQEVPDTNVPDLLAPEFELNTTTHNDFMDAEDWRVEIFINEQKAA